MLIYRLTSGACDRDDDEHQEFNVNVEISHNPPVDIMYCLCSLCIIYIHDTSLLW